MPLKAILTVDDEPFGVVNATDISCSLQAMFGTFACEWQHGEEDNELYVDGAATLPSGVYGLEVKGKLNGIPWRTFTQCVLKVTYATEQGDNSPVEPSADIYDVRMEVQLYKSASSDEKIAEHNADEAAHPYIQGLIPDVSGLATKTELAAVEAEIPTLPEHIVTDAGYVHTDNNYTTAEKGKLAGLHNYDDTAVRGLIDGKVDKVTGKGLSTNDFTDEYKSLLDNATGTGDIANTGYVDEAVGVVQQQVALKQDKVAKVQMVFTADNPQAHEVKFLAPNTIAEVTYVDYIDLGTAPPVAGSKTEYCFTFDVGDTVPTLTLPSDIVWAEEITLEANTHYVVLISYENGGYYGDWKSYPITSE